MCTSPFIRIPVSDAAAVHFKYRKLVKNGGIFFGSEKSSDYHDFVEEHSKYKGCEFPFEVQRLPCGQCMDCRIAYSKMWANRCMLEAKQYEHNYFITLTYDDEHLINNVRWTVSRKDGELGHCAELSKDDFTKFKKRLLESLFEATGHRGVRFFMCGEYGSKNGRPHFHAILFNCPFPDIKFHSKTNLNGFKYSYFTSELLTKAWGKGHVMIGEMCWETAAYVARYVIKKFHSDEEKTYRQFCELNNVEPLQPEFVNMSRKPGIARAYYEEHKDEIYQYDNIVVVNGRITKPFRYFDKLFELDNDLNPFVLAQVKEERKRVSELKRSIKYSGMSPSEVELAEKTAADRKSRSYEKLKREL